MDKDAADSRPLSTACSHPRAKPGNCAVPLWLGAFCRHHDVEPFRSEMIVYYLHMERLVAGQVDLVLRTEERFYCCDYKQDPTPKYTGCGPQLSAWRKRTSSTARRALARSRAGSDRLYKYSAQQNICGHIAAEQYNIDFATACSCFRSTQAWTQHTVSADGQYGSTDCNRAGLWNPPRSMLGRAGILPLGLEHFGRRAGTTPSQTWAGPKLLVET